MSERKDPPIEPLPYRAGVTIIDIGDVRVLRGMSRRPHSACQHRRLHYDPSERRIWCADCERDLEGFDAFQTLAEQCHEFYAQNKRRAEELAKAEQFQARSRAVKALDHVWRSRSMVPCCPHCHRGLLPEDMLRGVSSVGVEYERARRAKAAKP